LNFNDPYQPSAAVLKCRRNIVAGCAATLAEILASRGLNYCSMIRQVRSRLDGIAADASSGDLDEQCCAFFKRLVTTSSNSIGYDRANHNETIKRNYQKTEMLQKARAAFPLTKIRERAFEGAFLSVALIAMAGWVYFITLLLVRLFFWFLG
jgi:hypothetical protein